MMKADKHSIHKKKHIVILFTDVDHPQSKLGFRLNLSKLHIQSRGIMNNKLTSLRTLLIKQLTSSFSRGYKVLSRCLLFPECQWMAQMSTGELCFECYLQVNTTGSYCSGAHFEPYNLIYLG